MPFEDVCPSAFALSQRFGLTMWLADRFPEAVGSEWLRSLEMFDGDLLPVSLPYPQRLCELSFDS